MAGAGNKKGKNKGKGTKVISATGPSPNSAPFGPRQQQQQAQSQTLLYPMPPSSGLGSESTHRADTSSALNSQLSQLTTVSTTSNQAFSPDSSILDRKHSLSSDNGDSSVGPIIENNNSDDYTYANSEPQIDRLSPTPPPPERESTDLPPPSPLSSSNTTVPAGGPGSSALSSSAADGNDLDLNFGISGFDLPLKDRTAALLALQAQVKLAQLQTALTHAEQLYVQAIEQLSNDKLASAENLFKQYQCIQPYISLLAAKIAWLTQVDSVNKNNNNREAIQQLTEQMGSQRASMPGFSHTLLNTLDTDIRTQITALKVLTNNLATLPVANTVDALLERQRVLVQASQTIASIDAAVQASQSLIERMRAAKIDCTKLDKVLQDYDPLRQEIDTSLRQSDVELNLALATWSSATREYLAKQQPIINTALGKTTRLQIAAEGVSKTYLPTQLDLIATELLKINTARKKIDRMIGEASRLASVFPDQVNPIIVAARQNLASKADEINQAQMARELLVARADHDLQSKLIREWQDRVVNTRDLQGDKTAFAIAPNGIVANEVNKTLNISTVNRSTVNLHTATKNNALLRVTISSTVNMTLDQKIIMAAKMATVTFFAGKSPIEVAGMDFTKLKFTPPSGNDTPNDRFIAAVQDEVARYILDAQTLFMGKVQIGVASPAPVPVNVQNDADHDEDADVVNVGTRNGRRLNSQDGIDFSSASLSSSYVAGGRNSPYAPAPSTTTTTSVGSNSSSPSSSGALSGIGSQNRVASPTHVDLDRVSNSLSQQRQQPS